jgi:EAL domain-containing protein (putative c-di-GMP-specific phosphodiesterase class I)
MKPVLAPPEPLADLDLRAALAEARIQTLYQPIVRMEDCRPVGLEVLARLDHPERGFLTASLFVPPMECAGLAQPLTEAVIRRAFADWGNGKLEGPDLTLAINLPLDVLLIPDMLAWLDDEAAAAGIAPERIIIELTESQPLARLPELAIATARLRARGYGLAIDDVGPDIRDHSPLLDLPFTVLKLDKNLVQQASQDRATATFLATTLRNAAAASLTVIAEGVEDAETWAHMVACGVHQAQGFLVSHPLSANAIPAWIESWRGCA